MSASVAAACTWREASCNPAWLPPLATGCRPTELIREWRHEDPHTSQDLRPPIQSFDNASRRVSAQFLGDRSCVGCDHFPGVGHAPVGCGGKEPNIVGERHQIEAPAYGLRGIRWGAAVEGSADARPVGCVQDRADRIHHFRFLPIKAEGVLPPGQLKGQIGRADIDTVQARGRNDLLNVSEGCVANSACAKGVSGTRPEFMRRAGETARRVMAAA